MSARTNPGFLKRLLAWLSTPSGIGALFLLGLALRLLLAPSDGFPTDMSAFKAWAGRLAERGPWDFYPRGGEEYFVDYPPGYLYVLWIMGLAARAVGVETLPDIWIKLPAIFADLALAGLVMMLAQRLTPPAAARRLPLRALAAGAILLNPAVIFVSAVWGQADSVLALLVVAALLLIGTGPPTLLREAGGMALLAVAVGTKPQAGFVIPLVLLVLVWRHVRERVVETDHPDARRREAWTGIGRVAFLGAVGVAAGFVLFAPFRLFPAAAFDFYVEASRTYRVTSVFAFNMWGAVGFWQPDSGADAVEILGLPAVVWGIALFVVIGAIVLARAWAALRRGVEAGRVLVFGSMAFTLAGFAVVTRIHERYLFLPLALGAVFVSQRFLRRAFFALSLCYLVNVYFPYVYYVERERLRAPKMWGLFDALYGPDIDGTRMTLLSAAITAVCIGILLLGWRALEAAPTPSAIPHDEVVIADEAQARPPWTFTLHRVGGRGALIALAVFAVALLSRVAGLGHPPGMYFDEVYHARTGAEYLGNKEVFEYTHPPFAKEVMGSATHRLSGFGSSDGQPLPRGVVEQTVTTHPRGLAWVDDRGTVASARLDPGCGVTDVRTVARTDVRGDALVATRTAVMVGGADDTGPVLAKTEPSGEVWRATLPSAARSATAVGERAFVITSAGELVTVSPEGEPKTLAIGASDMSASAEEVWVAFSSDRRIASWDAEAKRTAVIELREDPRSVAAPDDVERVFVGLADSVIAYDTESKSPHETIEGGADLLGTVPETTAVWAAAGDEVRVIEPHSGVVIGALTFATTPQRLTADGGGHRLVGIADEGIVCAGGRPQLAWRLGSAIAGAAMVAFLFLIGLRLTGSLLAALLAALFLTVEGLAFTIARIAMNDSYTTAFILGAWVCVLSALYVWRNGDRLGAVAWLAGTGIFAGLGLASKWVALYAIAAIGIVLLWDGFRGRENSIWRVAGGFGASTGVLAFLCGVLPLAIYVLTYTPYFRLGHGIGDFLALQRDMFDYHAGLTATHPFGSPWYGWPFGYRAVFLYLSGEGNARSEIWTIPNLVVIWGGLVAMGATVVRARRVRSVALAVIVLAAAAQYVPWIAVSRVTFMYHYLPAVPWLALALGWFLAVGLADWRYRKVAIVAVSASAVAVFGFLYPILVGWEMPVRYLDLVRELFPWVI